MCKPCMQVLSIQLRKLVQNDPTYKGKGDLTLKMRKKLTSAARCAIKMRSKESDRQKGIKLLERDLKHGPTIASADVVQIFAHMPSKSQLAQ